MAVAAFGWWDADSDLFVLEWIHLLRSILICCWPRVGYLFNRGEVFFVQLCGDVNSLKLKYL